jgi:hypothetical protein
MLAGIHFRTENPAVNMMRRKKLALVRNATGIHNGGGKHTALLRLGISQLAYASACHSMKSFGGRQRISQLVRGNLVTTMSFRTLTEFWEGGSLQHNLRQCTDILTAGLKAPITGLNENLYFVAVSNPFR